MKLAIKEFIMWVKYYLLAIFIIMVLASGYLKLHYFAQFEAIMVDLYDWPGEKYEGRTNPELWKEYIKWIQGEDYRNITVDSETDRLVLDMLGSRYIVHKKWYEDEIYVVPYPDENP